MLLMHASALVPLDFVPAWCYFVLGLASVELLTMGPCAELLCYISSQACVSRVSAAAGCLCIRGTGDVESRSWCEPADRGVSLRQLAACMLRLLLEAACCMHAVATADWTELRVSLQRVRVC